MVCWKELEGENLKIDNINIGSVINNINIPKLMWIFLVIKFIVMTVYKITIFLQPVVIIIRYWCSGCCIVNCCELSQRIPCIRVFSPFFRTFSITVLYAYVQFANDSWFATIIRKYKRTYNGECLYFFFILIFYRRNIDLSYQWYFAVFE